MTHYFKPYKSLQRTREKYLIKTLAIFQKAVLEQYLKNFWEDADRDLQKSTAQLA